VKRMWMLAGIAGLVVGCGSSTSGPPLKTYSYGAGALPSGTQESAALAAENGFQGISAAGTNVAGASSAPTLADSVANAISLANGSGALLRSPGVSLPAAAGAEPVAAAARSGMAGALRSPALQASCAQVGDHSITYANCSYSSDGFNGTLNGTITVNGGTVTWDITYTISISTQGVTGNGSFHFNGNLTVTATTIVGSGRSEYVVHASGNGESIEVGQTTGFDANLQYSSPQYCVTGGTLEIRRSMVISGAQNASSDGGVKFTWTGCGSFTVAVGT
jgi:hypothetical protein